MQSERMLSLSKFSKLIYWDKYSKSKGEYMLIRSLELQVKGQKMVNVCRISFIIKAIKFTCYMVFLSQFTERDHTGGPLEPGGPDPPALPGAP